MRNGKESSKPTLPPSSGNKFTNDGSFMEMFKKQMEEKQRQNDSEKRQHETKSTGSATSSNESHSTGTEKLQASSSSESTDKRTIKPEKKNYSFFVRLSRFLRKGVSYRSKIRLSLR